MDNNQLYKEISSLSRNIGRLEGKVDGMGEQLSHHFDRMNRIDNIIQKEMHILEQNAHHISERVSNLEKRQFAIYAIAGAVATVISLAPKFFGLFK